MVANRLIHNIAIAIDAARNDGQVLFFNGAGLELGGQRIVRTIVLGNDNDTARVSVESVDDSRPGWPPSIAELPEMVRQGAGERSLPMPLSWMNNHSGRFVDHDQITIFVQHIDGQCLGSGTRTGNSQLKHLDALTRAQFLRGLATSLFYQYLAGGNYPLDGRSTDHPAELMGQEYVQPPTLTLCGHQKSIWFTLVC
jgi:hypothetical protein